MRLIILRHGMTGAAESDEFRELTAKGVKEVENVVRLRIDELQNVTRMYSSPMIRVKQTLEIAARVTGFQGPIIESRELTTGSRLNEIISFMNGLDFANGDIMVSSHQSCTSILVLWLTGEDVLISNGSLLAIDVEKSAQGCGNILWQESHNSREIKRTTSFVDQF
jgi:phosphohistidine phosphatase SixA